MRVCDGMCGVVLQGRVACEINTADELLVTELMFNGAFNDLTPQQSVRGGSLYTHRNIIPRIHTV